jgi:hypothetical protein
VKSHLLSALAHRFAMSSLEKFQEQHPHHWLLWEPGDWSPPAPTTFNEAAPVPTPVATSIPPISTPVSDSSLRGEILGFELTPQDSSGVLTLGRGEKCNLCINDGTLSQLHLVLMPTADGLWTVRDAGSRNGSTLDGKPLEPGVPRTLCRGSRLSAAAVRFSFYDPPGMLARLNKR